jgi:hypothetical protein
MRLSILVLAVLTLTGPPNFVRAGVQSALSGPPIPYEDTGACPFEGCVYRAWQASDTVSARRTRSARAAVLFTVRKGETITALTAVVVTTSPGRVRFREPIDLSSRSGSVHVEPGETLYLLTYGGEGFTKVWFKGKLYEELDGSTAFFNAICDTEPSHCVGTIIARPQRTWWVSIRNARGQIGWTNEPDKFSGKDSLGH